MVCVGRNLYGVSWGRAMLSLRLAQRLLSSDPELLYGIFAQRGEPGGRVMVFLCLGPAATGEGTRAVARNVCSGA